MSTAVLQPQTSTKTLSRTASRRFIMSPPSREHISTLSISPPLPLLVVPPPSIKVTPAASSSSACEDQIFTLTDEELSDAYKFEREVGYGNWGSVWLCKRKLNNPGQKVAIKLVHRSKTPTTAARVRSLWNEMKTLKTLPAAHPSIIQFESFIISPSYALVVMPYVERLMPVNLSEDEALPCFRDLISAVAYLHDNMITHNDIKPANVLLRDDNTPVLVDFGFATKWEASNSDRFYSTISWGTPEYLSSTRARGKRHDERTSDVWSLGITLFEILTGRTPFETSEQEQFSTPEELQVYYERTVTGLWVGAWDISVGVEDLLKRMIHPDETLRITAASALKHSSIRDTPNFARPSTTPSYVKHSAKPLPAQPAPSPPSALLNVNIGSSSSTIYRDPAGPKKYGNMSPPKKARAGLTTSPSRETLKSNGTAKQIRIKAHSPSKKPIAASSPTHRRVVSKVNRTAVHPSSPARVKNHSPAGSIATPPKYLRPTNENHTLSPTSPPRNKQRNPDRNLGPRGTESPKTKRRHSRVLVDVTVSTGNEQADSNASPAKKAGAKGDRREQLARKPDQKSASPRKRASQADIRAARVQKSLRDLRATFEQGPPGSPEPPMPSAGALEAAALDSRLDRISLWVRNVERIVEEARSTLHDPSLLDDSSLDSIIPPLDTLSPPTSPMHLTAVNATPTRSSLAQMASQIVTPTRTLVDGVAVVLPGGRPLADVPESVGAPSPGPRGFLTPPARGKSAPAIEEAQDEEAQGGGRVYETIAFGGYGRPIDGTMEKGVVAVGEEPVKDSMGRGTTGRLRRSKSKLLALFQLSTDPKATLNGETPDPERLSFLKFPPPAPAPSSSHTSKPPHYIHARHPSAPSNNPPTPSSHGRKPSMLRLRSSFKNLRKSSRPSVSSSGVPNPTPMAMPSLPTPPPTPAAEEADEILLSSPDAVVRQGAGWGSPPPTSSPTTFHGYAGEEKMKRKSMKSLKNLFIPQAKEEYGREREHERERAGTPWTMNSQWTDVTEGTTVRGEGSLGGRWMRSLGFKRGRA